MFRIVRNQISRCRISVLAPFEVCNQRPAASLRTFSSAKPYRAAILEEFNKKLTIEQIKNRNSLSEGMVRVGVKYCSLNLNDVKNMENESEDFILPMIPGTEFSGEILELGKNCKQNFQIGEKVSSLLAYKCLGGGLAEECVVSEDECFHIGSVSLKNAAVLSQGHGTALLAFTKFYELQEGDSIIVICGAGGNGLAAIQLASSVFKAKVYAICDTEDTSALLREEGAYKSISINEGLPSVYKFLASSFKEKKAKVVYDAVGGGLFYVVSDFMDPEGHFLTADPFHSPEKLVLAKADIDKALKKYRKADKESDDFVPKIRYVDISEYRTTDLDLYRQIVQDTFALCEEEIITPYVSRCFGLHDINEAVKFIKEKKCTGKILVDVRAEETTKKDDDDSGSDDENEKK